MSGADALRAQAISGADLADRLDAHLRSTGLLPRGAAITIALSGGLDSVALLVLLQSLQQRWGWRLSAAHFDHRMREESAADADWVAAFCADRAVPCRLGRAPVVPGNEAEARKLRYEFLERARANLGADRLATGHQADDQAETVLFRLLRGSGLAGLAGIPAHRHPGVVRPLLPFRRAEIEEYARAQGLPYLEDPTNLDLSIARNRLRHWMIPGLEANGWPGLRVQLCRLAELAARASERVERASERVAGELVVEASEGRIVVARTRFLAYDNRVRAHLVRVLAGRLGPRPGRVGTRIALEFINRCPSGRRVELAGGIVIAREFDRLLFERRRPQEPARDGELVLSELGDGAGHVQIGGVEWRLRWQLGARGARMDSGERFACFEPSELRLPLTVRAWRPGDRMRLRGGTRKLKKVFVDRRVGRSERGGIPLLTDRAGVLWVVGLVQGARAAPAEEGEIFSVSFEREA
jgi:tRNA(Ile)-lysidine synthase